MKSALEDAEDRTSAEANPGRSTKNKACGEIPRKAEVNQRSARASLQKTEGVNPVAAVCPLIQEMAISPLPYDFTRCWCGAVD